MTDPFVGKLYYFRVYSGTAAQGMEVLNPRTNRRERLGRLLQMHANHREERKEIFSGDIAAAVGLKNVTTGDTICVESDPIVLESMGKEPLHQLQLPACCRKRRMGCCHQRFPDRSHRRKN